MDLRAVAFVLGNLLLVLALCLLVPLGVALYYDSRQPNEAAEVISFLVPFVLAGGVGALLRHLFRASAERVRLREGFAIVTFSWLLATAVGMLPYLVSGVTTHVADAFFETMSGFTTTGATVFPEVEIIPHGLMFWRCMTQWLGGMGIVVLSVALLPFLGVGGYRMLKAEAPGGVVFERERPRITDAAKDLWKLYLVFTAVQIALLMLGGLSAYDAICHAFTTMSTGGFSNHTASAGYFVSPFVQWVLIAFMFLAGMNFSLHAQMIGGQVRSALKNPELRLYAALLAGAVLLGVAVVPQTGGFEAHLRDVSFQVVSIGTTTGYATQDFDRWPQLMRLVLVMLMFVGGSMGSTGGGMKAARILVYFHALGRELHRLVFPHAIRPLRVGRRVLEPALVRNILAFGFGYTLAFVVGAAVMAGSGYDLVTSISASAAALGNIGPGLGDVGPTAHWGHLPDVAKWVMSALMLIGRLEVYSVLILLAPWVWRR